MPAGRAITDGAPLRVTSTTDALVAELRGRILGGTLRPGEPLPEIALANSFGVARPTVRSALQELVNRNLLHRPAGKSAMVPVLTVDDVHDLYFVRAPLEFQAVTAIASNGLDTPAARRALAAMEALPADASWADRVQAHTAFHIALVDAAESPRLSRLYPPLQEEMQLCLAQLHSSYPEPGDLAREHRILLDAVTSGEVDTAKKTMHEHLTHAVRQFTSQSQD
ncbi:GntR family transcriptional regulator [Tamaricihabitans halophyticus]|nr:GntR family transcriptional regulator [Tamaricihabitans halophyticus]